VFNFSTKILRCPETVLDSAEFNSCESVADSEGLECVSKHLHPSVCNSALSFAHISVVVVELQSGARKSSLAPVLAAASAVT